MLRDFEDQLNAHQGWEDFLGLEANTEFVRASRVCHGATIIPKIFTGGLSEILLQYPQSIPHRIIYQKEYLPYEQGTLDVESSLVSQNLILCGSCKQIVYFLPFLYLGSKMLW